MRALILPLLAVAAAIATPAFAQDATVSTAPPTAGPDMGVDDNRVTIGIGAALVPDYTGSNHDEITPGAVAIGKVAGHDFFTRGTQLYVNAIKNDGGPGMNFELGGIVGARFERTNRVDNRQVRALGELDTAYEVGGYVGIGKTGVITSDYDTLTARVAYVHDVSNTYDSYVITPQIAYTTPLSIRTLVSLGASADYAGKGFGRTYFTITPGQSLASGLRPYNLTGSGFQKVNLSFFALQSLSGDLRHGFGIGAGVLYGRLLGKYKDSPLVSDVGNANQWSGALGLSYTF